MLDTCDLGSFFKTMYKLSKTAKDQDDFIQKASEKFGTLVEEIIERASQKIGAEQALVIQELRKIEKREYRRARWQTASLLRLVLGGLTSVKSCSTKGASGKC